MTPATYRTTIFADYFEFVLMDEKSEDDFSTIVTEDALTRMPAVGRGTVCPGTLRNVDVPVEVHVVAVDPALELGEYDHAAEAFIEIPSGKLVVMSCTSYSPDAKQIEVEPGSYRVLSLASGLDSLQTEWEAASDLYTVYLWLGKPRSPRLLKHWKQAGA